MTEIQSSKKYDLEERTLRFAKDCRQFFTAIIRNVSNLEDGKQLIRSSGSVGANYIEANECLSRKDFFNRVKICRKEAKESFYWLSLIDCGDNQRLENARERLKKEANELMKIFGAIVTKEH
jgi:four helix bundle protein